MGAGWMGPGPRPAHQPAIDEFDAYRQWYLADLLNKAKLPKVFSREFRSRNERAAAVLARQRTIGRQPSQRPLHRSQADPDRLRELLLGRKLIARAKMSLADG